MQFIFSIRYWTHVKRMFFTERAYTKKIRMTHCHLSSTSHGSSYGNPSWERNVSVTRGKWVHLVTDVHRTTCLAPQHTPSSSFCSTSSQVSPARSSVLLAVLPILRYSSGSWVHSGHLAQLRRLCYPTWYCFGRAVVLHQRAQRDWRERRKNDSGERLPFWWSQGRKRWEKWCEVSEKPVLI